MAKLVGNGESASTFGQSRSNVDFGALLFLFESAILNHRDFSNRRHSHGDCQLFKIHWWNPREIDVFEEPLRQIVAEPSHARSLALEN
jgi:hypothetical protein